MWRGHLKSDTVYNSLDIDFIRGHIHGRPWKKRCYSCIFEKRRRCIVANSVN